MMELCSRCKEELGYTDLCVECLVFRLEHVNDAMRDHLVKMKDIVKNLKGD